MANAAEAWEGLPLPWQVAFEEAWASWKSGSAGVGAVILDAAGDIVSRGRSRVWDEPDGTSPLAGTFMAHAEMNALACLSPGNYHGYSIYTTFEPCAMCAATMLLYRLPVVLYAAADPVWDGMVDGFGQIPVIARRLPERECLGGPYGAFSHVLHLTTLLPRAPESVVDAHRSLSPHHLELARAIVKSGSVLKLADDGATVHEVAHTLWDELASLHPGPVR
jgi:tRNA(adenine34) deaminase